MNSGEQKPLTNTCVHVRESKLHESNTCVLLGKNDDKHTNIQTHKNTHTYIHPKGERERGFDWELETRPGSRGIGNQARVQRDREQENTHLSINTDTDI